MTRIYCDGMFDLFHEGHIEHFRKIKNLYNDVYLIVGIGSDEHVEKYKRKPIQNEETRYRLVESCKYVDEIVKDCSRIVTEKFIIDNNIDYVAHAFLTIDDESNQDLCFEAPRKMGKFLSIEYNQGISTTEIIKKIEKLNIDSSNMDEIKRNIPEVV